jgi:altronate dehydratase small subunit
MHSGKSLGGKLMKKALQVNEQDNVATATYNIEKGEKIEIISPEGEIILTTKIPMDVPFGHKVALKNLSEGDKVIKYGETIGLASKKVQLGDWVHIHNVVSARLHIEGPEKGIL